MNFSLAFLEPSVLTPHDNHADFESFPQSFSYFSFSFTTNISTFKQFISPLKSFHNHLQTLLIVFVDSARKEFFISPFSDIADKYY